MTSSDGLTSIDPWLYRQGFNVDSWLLPLSFSHDNDLLTKALHTTVTSSPSDFFDSSAVSNHESDPEIVSLGGAKRKRNCLLTESDKAVTKRRSRASKKSETTFITADPANFREMVQKVTGANFASDVVFPPPETNRIVVRSTAVPTLDTSAFLSNHRHENGYSGDGGVGLQTVEGGGGGSVVDGNAIFPTLESWKVM